MLSQIRVLVAEDEALVAEVIMRLLEDRGFNLLGFKWREIDILDEMREAQIWNIAWQ